ncbi:hypothetical protein [Hyphomonas sp.]|uniref:hypothetical protein n=1 Tax=Hyphomonas sp. TaxID=87 RepID=UPI0025C60123|nr:hypothetical protein [Hyphomonas sp.]
MSKALRVKPTLKTKLFLGRKSPQNARKLSHKEKTHGRLRMIMVNLPAHERGKQKRRPKGFKRACAGGRPPGVREADAGRFLAERQS